MKLLVKITTALIISSAVAAHAQIKIGQTAGFTGAVADGVKETADGAKLYFNAINKRGGVNGQQIELISLDDKFDPKLAKENARILIEEKNVLAMFLTRGTPHTEAVIEILDKNSVPLIAPSTGAMVLHTPVKKHIFNVRSTYQREAERVVIHLNSLGVKRIAMIQTDDSFGADGAAGVIRGLETSGLKAVLNEKIDRAKPDFIKVGPAVVASNAQAVILVASGANVVLGTNALRAAGSSAQIVTLSNNASSGFVKSMGANARGVMVSQVFPSERAVAFAFIKEAQDLQKKEKNASELSPAMLEGFVAAKVMVEALRQAGPTPTRTKLQNALETMKKFDVGGLLIGFNPEDHTGLDFVDMSVIGSDGRFKR